MPALGTNKVKKYNKVIPPSKKNSDPEERERLIAKYAPLVKTIAGRLALRLPQHISQDDLASAGLMGLLDAIDRFDVEQGVAFKSYAEFRIKGAMIDELRSMDWVPRSVRRNAKLLEEAYTRIERKLMRPARDEEVAKEMDLDLESFHRLIDDARGVSIINEYDIVNQNAKFISEKEDNLNSLLISINPFESLNQAEIVRIVAKAIDGLPKKERTVVSLYYYEDLTMKEIGEVMGYTESRVSQLHTKAVIRLRSSLREYFEK